MATQTRSEALTGHWMARHLPDKAEHVLSTDVLSTDVLSTDVPGVTTAHTTVEGTMPITALRRARLSGRGFALVSHAAREIVRSVR